MAFSFRYRYVDFQTVFTGAPGPRASDQGLDSPGTLYANELATDVGRTCWDRNEPLAVLDHHFSRDGQFPSASAAVLHKARLIRQKFASQDGNVIWLVTHKQPDFDALLLFTWRVGSSKTRLPPTTGGLTACIPTAVSICLTAARSTGLSCVLPTRRPSAAGLCSLPVTPR